MRSAIESFFRDIAVQDYTVIDRVDFRKKEVKNSRQKQRERGICGDSSREIVTMLTERSFAFLP